MESKVKLYNLPQHATNHHNLQLLRIISTPDYLKADFGYYATDYYIRGGWVKMSKNTYVKELSGKKKKLIKAANIPIAPKQLDFNTSHDWLYFSLFFESISDKVTTIDIIENETDNPNDFNFYNIQLENKINLK